MRNQYFQFKEFTIHQKLSAMKVTTDACLFGAWCAEKFGELISKDSPDIKGLDIGTGTGLLSLMLAQKVLNAQIDAVEMEENAFKEASTNIADSTFNERITVHHSTIQSFNITHQYDFIISNPPFFEDDLKSNNQQRNMAMHCTSLSMEELLLAIKQHLAPKGIFALLLPNNNRNSVESMAVNIRFNLHHQAMIKQTENHNYFRKFLLFTNYPTSYIEETITIKIDNNYSKRFKDLLKDYYLKL